MSLLCLSLSIGAARGAAAQTQTIVLTPRLDKSCNSFPANPGELVALDAEELIKDATRKDTTALKGSGKYDPNLHYVLHIAKFNSQKSIEQDAWYAFFNGQLDHERLYGTSKVTLIVAYSTGDSGSLPPLASLVYEIEVTKKQAAPLQNLKGIASFAMHSDAKKVEPKTACEALPLNINWLPSDMKFSANLADGEKTKELSAQTFDNERKYVFDFTLALPLKSYNDLSFDIDNGTATAKKVEKTDLFAVVNVGWPRDTKRMKAALPTLLYGMPITGRPLKKHLLAVGLGYSKVQFFGGYLFSLQETAAATAGNDQVSLDVQSAKKWDKTFVWGVNLSVKFVTDLLKAKD